MDLIVSNFGLIPVILVCFFHLNYREKNQYRKIGPFCISSKSKVRCNVCKSPQNQMDSYNLKQNFLDLAVVNEGSNNVSILLGTGTGSFGTATNFAVGSQPRSVTVGDFN